MLTSMTGFGSSEATYANYTVKVEVKTLNSKFLDLITRIPREISHKEAEVKALLTQYLKRGKVNIGIDIIPVTSDNSSALVNKDLFKTYYNELVALAEEVGADPKDAFKLALHSPEVISDEPLAFDIDWESVKVVVVRALEKCADFREQEGRSLQSNLKEYVTSIGKGLEKVTEHDPNRIAQVKERINSHLEEIEDKTKIDANRFEQELIYYIEKIDITEEKVRLAGHLDYFTEVMESGDAQGKKLGFISQEIGREINTIGAKANDAVVQRAVVQMKDELEKIKEQCMNIV